MIKRSFIALSLIILGSFGMATLYPATANAASCGPDTGKILTFVPWYRGLTNSDCSIKSPASFTGGLQAFIWVIIMNIVEDIFQATSYVAVGFIMFGGFMFMTSAGNPERASRGRKTLLNAVIGLVVAVSAGFIVNYIGKALGAV